MATALRQSEPAAPRARPLKAPELQALLQACDASPVGVLSSALLWLGYHVLTSLPETVKLRREHVLEDGLQLSSHVLPLQGASLQAVADVLRESDRALARLQRGAWCVRTAERRMARLADDAGLRRFSWLELRAGGLLQLHHVKGYATAARLASHVGLSLPAQLRMAPSSEPLVLAAGRTSVTTAGVRVATWGGFDVAAGPDRR